MADIKTRNKIRDTIKTLDKASVSTQKIKDNIIEIKNKTNRLQGNNESNEVEYAENKVMSATKKSSEYGIRKGNKIGKNGIPSAKDNYKKLKQNKHFLERKQNAKKIARNMTGKANKTIKNSKVAIKTSKEVAKQTEIAVKTTVKTSQKAVKVMQTTIKTIQSTAKTASAVVKSTIAGVKALASLIMAGGWIVAFIIIIVVCIASIFTLWNSEPTGDASVDSGNIVLVAKSQLGNVGGEPYWSWYGFENRVEWCACFVSWCAEQCSYIENNTIPKFSLCSDGITWFKDKDLWLENGNPPSSGFIIFFDWENDGVCDHVGIVEYLNGNTVHTIEGNSNEDTCRQKEYQIDSNVIVGYGMPIYNT